MIRSVIAIVALGVQAEVFAIAQCEPWAGSCPQAHNRSPLECSFGSAALSRLKRIVMAIEELRREGKRALPVTVTPAEKKLLERFHAQIAKDLMSPRAIPIFEETLARDDVHPQARLRIVRRMDEPFGLLSRADLRWAYTIARGSFNDMTSSIEV
jgi:hypothetical protein